MRQEWKGFENFVGRCKSYIYIDL